VDDAQFEELKALILPISNWVAVQTGQAAAQGPTTRSIIAAQAGSQALMAIPAGVDNPGPYRVYRMNVPALPDDVDPDGEAIWQVIGMKGRPIGAPTSRADADAQVARLMDQRQANAADPRWAGSFGPEGVQYNAGPGTAVPGTAPFNAAYGANPNAPTGLFPAQGGPGGPFVGNPANPGIPAPVGVTASSVPFNRPAGSITAAPAENATVAGAAPPGPANPGPYTHHWSLADLWHVRGKNGTPTGFTGNEPDAKAEADRLNSAESPHHDGPGVNEASLPVTPDPPTPVETNVGTLPAPAAPSR